MYSIKLLSMKRLLVIVLILMCGTVSAQGVRLRTGLVGFSSAEFVPIPGYTRINARYEWIAGAFDSGLHVPQYNGIPTDRSGVWSADGNIGVDTLNGYFYWRSGGLWMKAAKFSDISNGIDSFWRTPGVDSFYWQKEHITYAVLDSTGGSTDNRQTAYYFPRPVYGSNINYGYYFIEGKKFGSGSFEAWVRPKPGAQYVVSDGFGGSHVELFGFSGGMDYLELSGNCYNEYVSVGLTGVDRIDTNSVVHIAVSFRYEPIPDITYITTYVNGVPSGKAQLSGQRRNPVSEGAGTLYIGGSDHNGLFGVLFKFRMIEGHDYFNGLVFKPKFYFDNYLPYVTVVSDLTDKNYPLLDRGNPWWGQRHDGKALAVQGDSHPQNYPRDSIPHQIYDSIPIAGNTYIRGTTAPSGSPLIYDHFERADQVPAFYCTNTKNDGSPDLDSTQGGSLGKKRYTYLYNDINTYAGITGTHAFFVQGAQNVAYVVGNSPDQDIRVTINSASQDIAVDAVGRYTDENNRIYARVYGTGLSVTKVVAGVFTSLGSYTIIGSWSELKLTINDTEAKAYIDGVERVSSTSVGDIPDANKVGFGSNSAFTRIKSFYLYSF